MTNSKESTHILHTVLTLSLSLYNLFIYREQCARTTHILQHHCQLFTRFLYIIRILSSEVRSDVCLPKILKKSGKAAALLVISMFDTSSTKTGFHMRGISYDVVLSFRYPSVVVQYNADSSRRQHSLPCQWKKRRRTCDKNGRRMGSHFYSVAGMREID